MIRRVEGSKFKVGDKLKIIGTGSTVSNVERYYGKYGAKKGDIVIVEGVTTEGGGACLADPRYYGTNFNGREKDFVLYEEYEVPKKMTIKTIIKNIENSKILLINK